MRTGAMNRLAEYCRLIDEYDLAIDAKDADGRGTWHLGEQQRLSDAISAVWERMTPAEREAGEKYALGIYLKRIGEG